MNFSWIMGLLLIFYFYMCMCVLLVIRNFRILKKMMLFYRCIRNLKLKLWVLLYCLYDWVFVLVVVLKCNGGICLCINLKLFNEVLMWNYYLIFIIEDILFELYYVCIFFIVDVKDGFWYIEFDSDSSYFIIFVILWGKYCWLRMF